MPKGVYLHKSPSKETILKRSLAMKGRMPKNIVAGWNKGLKGCYKLSEETKKKISEHHKRTGVGKWMKNKTGESANNWSGNEVGYGGLHIWVRNKLGKPHYCEHCKSKKNKRYEWANISKLYTREITDWIRLCVSCHRKYDMTPEKIEVLKEKLKLANKKLNEIRRHN